MGRIIAIDYGLKRTGIAVTDPLKIIASPLETIPSSSLVEFLKDFLTRNEVEAFVVGMPIDTRGADTDATASVKAIIERLKRSFIGIPVVEQDERFTSTIARRAMVEGGLPKQKRRDKGTVDKISATLILQSYLDRR